MCFPLKIKTYRYGADGQRALKYVVNSNTSTMYFNKMWQVNNIRAENVQSKHIFVGETRIATKINSADNNNTATERVRTYYYHSDHLGSAQTVTNWQGNIHERLEYTPYGETWIDWRNTGESSDKTPFRFTAKERDEETGLYYFGARYLDARTSRWLSVDPAMYEGDYFPVAPNSDEARRHNQNLPGMGGIYNYVNFHVYHYGGNNPVKYVDPDGRSSLRREQLIQAQNTVMNSVIYKRGGGGSHPRTGTFGPDVTYCNLATYDLAIAVGFNTNVLFGNKRYDTNANNAGRNLRNAAATEGSGIIAVSPQAAQILANEGYLVIASWVNDGGIGHIATVRPSSTSYDPDLGPLIANVGQRNGVSPERRAFDRGAPLYFIDTNQNINNNVNPLNMARVIEQ